MPLLHGEVMHIYRYRPYSLLAQKELIYDELYFASREELNDPLDMQTRFVFQDENGQRWQKLLTELWGQHPKCAEAAHLLASLSPLTYQAITEQFKDISDSLLATLINEGNSDLKTMLIARSLIEKLHSFLLLYAPSSAYSVSFSRDQTETLMWSHYAGNHSGFCLIFLPRQGSINQCKHRSRNEIEVSPGHTSVTGTSFPVEEISYKDQLTDIDAFTLFPMPFTGIIFPDDASKDEYHREKKRQLITKSRCWDYEAEMRIFLPQPTKHISGVNDLDSFTRLYYYDFDQLTGIVFGHRMDQGARDSLLAIIERKLNDRVHSVSRSNEKLAMSDFLIQQARICETSRKVLVENIGLYHCGKFVESGSRFFDKQFDLWKKGFATTYDNGKINQECMA